MIYDLEDFIDKLKEEELLKEVKEEVSAEFEAGAFCSMSNRVGGPAFHFTNVKEYPEHSLVGSLFSGPGNLFTSNSRFWSRMALSMELPKNIAYEELCDELTTRVDNPMMPIEVDEGPCKEVIIEEDDVDLTNLPIPRLHECDGGRYGTMGYVIVKDPETGWENWGIYRWMVVGQKSITVYNWKHPYMKEGKHLYHILNKYTDQEEPIPFCIAIGGAPVLTVAAAMNAPAGTSETSIASGLALEPMQLVKAETNEIMVPVDAEVIIEGEIMPGEMAYEGPFPEYHRIAPKKKCPLFRVKTITHKKNIIWPFAVEGSQISDSMALLSVIHSTDLLKLSKKAFIHTRWINLIPETKLSWCVISTKVPYNGYVGRLAKFLFSCSPYKWFDKILVVDTDVEPVDLGRCLNDLCQKVHKAKDWRISEPIAPLPLNATYGDSNGLGARAIIDATWPVGFDINELPLRTAFDINYPPELQKSIIERWTKELGFNKKPIVPDYLVKKLGISKELVY